ncbi:MAG: DUF4157 domain-containing protein [Steroidobacteraceae bacterium]
MSRPSARLPEPVEDALCEILGSGVRRVRLVPQSLYARLHRRADATTRRNVIYLRGTLAEFAADPALLLHEYFHVIHQWRSRRLTLVKYLLECLRHGYWNNRFEREARDFTSAHLHRLMSLLQRDLANVRLASGTGRYANPRARHPAQDSLEETDQQSRRSA